MAQNKKRNYEVSVWTLQDEFITVLKPSNIEYKGQTENAKAKIKDDGTEEFNFSIPMKLYDIDTQFYDNNTNKRMTVNPIWLNTRDGTIVQDLRKIKLTFNKGTENEKIFEFLITDVTERHENDQLYCDVSCEGFAFHELGKIGYKISLSSEDFYDDDYSWFIGESEGDRPRANLQYWMNKILPYLPESGPADPSIWYYKIEMDWSSFELIWDTLTSSWIPRASDKIYEEPYVKNWTETETGYSVNQIEASKEKERMVDLEESNIYNLTQELAKIFGVFCRYEYEHDATGHISKRTVIFYNNYVKENEGYLDLTYPYSTSAITRTRDGKEVTTKMFVRPADDQSDLITIMDVGANRSGEDYLLNFDYLYNIGNVTAEQYVSIPEYEKKFGYYNKRLNEISDSLSVLSDQKIKLEASKTLLTNSIQLDKERLGAVNDLLNNLTDVDGTIEINNLNPRTAILIKSSKTDANNSYHINLSDKGIIVETIKIYRGYDFATKTLNSEITTGVPERDEFGDIIRVSSIYKGNDDKTTVYITYQYLPRLSYENVKRTWEERLAKDERGLNEAQTKLDIIEDEISIYEQQYNNLLNKKQEVISSFQKMMGPALRESYWQPDDYTDYGDTYIDDFMIQNDASSTPGDSGLSTLIWDNKAFDDEQQYAGYNITINQTLHGYPIIDLSSHMDIVKNHYKELSFMFYDFKYLDDPNAKTARNMRVFSIGSTAQYGFVLHNNVIKPVLILTGYDTLSDDSRERLIAYINGVNPYSPIIGVITTTINGSSISTSIDQNASWSVSLNDFLSYNQNYDPETSTSTNEMFSAKSLYYLRIKIDSLKLRTDENKLILTYGDNKLENFEDYYILKRDNSYWDDGEFIIQDSSYYITLKPEALFNYQNIFSTSLKIKFNISNANTAIYLDAIKVLKENSQPKVSYTIDPSVIDEEFLYSLYNKLCYICNINDYELKFENVQGYISELELDCDHPQNDKIEIKNYKTKFEDLFSSIVAQTEEMKKSAYSIGVVSTSFDAEGRINGSILQKSLQNVDLDYAFNNGKLTIDEQNGIWSVSDSGVVAIRGGGIFTANEKDSNGNWKWNTGIVPGGINADLITTGQLDTNLIKIYAGDRIKFQMNGDGLFAYKSVFEDQEIMNAARESSTIASKLASNTNNDLDTSQYVVHNSEGLFLIAAPGALILNENKDDFVTVDQEIKRVEISWNGLKLRNWSNQEVFYADANTGNLTLQGVLKATDIEILNNITLGGENSSGILTLQGDKIRIDTNNFKVNADGQGSVQVTGSIVATSLEINNINDVNRLVNQSDVGHLVNSSGALQTMTFYPERGLEIKIPGNSHYSTLTTNDGYYIQYDDTKIAQFTGSVTKIRQLQIGNLIVKPTSNGGWKWVDAQA